MKFNGKKIINKAISDKISFITYIVPEFIFYERAFTEESIKVLRFSEYNDEWFDFIILNRNLESTEQKHEYDIIEGPVADDKVQLVEKLVNDFDFDEQTAIDKFFSSNVFRELSDIKNKLYENDWTEIYDLLLRELKMKI